MWNTFTQTHSHENIWDEKIILFSTQNSYNSSFKPYSNEREPTFLTKVEQKKFELNKFWAEKNWAERIWAEKIWAEKIWAEKIWAEKWEQKRFWLHKNRFEFEWSNWEKCFRTKLSQKNWAKNLFERKKFCLKEITHPKNCIPDIAICIFLFVSVSFQ